MKLQEIAPEHRPRERLAQFGAQTLSTAELLALVLKSGTKQENILDLCHKLLAKYGLAGLAQASLKELQQEHGVGTAKAAQIMALFELAQRTSFQTATIPIKNAKMIAELYLGKFQTASKEQVLALYLDTKHKIIHEEMITLGLLNASLIHPREIFHGAVKQMAHTVIVIHNHPSGDPTPSEEDLTITEKLAQAGEIVGIRLLDHIILGKNSWWSWRETRNL